MRYCRPKVVRHKRLFICALWLSAGKGLTSWLSFVVFNCEFVTFPLVCGTWLYRFLIFAPLLTLSILSWHCRIRKTFPFRLQEVWFLVQKTVKLYQKLCMIWVKELTQSSVSLTHKPNKIATALLNFIDEVSCYFSTLLYTKKQMLLIDTTATCIIHMLMYNHGRIM